jgi:hypothetical protein
MHQHLSRRELDGTMDLRSDGLRDPLQGFSIEGFRGRLILKHADHRDFIAGRTHEVKGEEAWLFAHQGHKALLDVPGDLALRARSDLDSSDTESHRWRWCLGLRARLLDEG